MMETDPSQQNKMKQESSNSKSKNLKKSQNNTLEFNPFIMEISRFKIEKTFNDRQYISYSNLILGTTRKNKPKKKKQQNPEKLSARNTGDKDKDSSQKWPNQQLNTIEIVCQFCAQNVSLAKLDHHLKSCKEAIFCKNCNQYILKRSKKYHQQSCEIFIKQQVRFHNKLQDEIEIEKDQNQNQGLLLDIMIKRLTKNSKNKSKKKEERAAEEKQFKFKSMGLQIKPFSKQNVNQQDRKLTSKCIICNTQYEENENIVWTNCNHTFHEDCISLWISAKQSCPMCNEALMKP